MREKMHRLIELLAERESLALKIDYLKGKNIEADAAEMSKKMKEIENSIATLSNTLNSSNIPFYLVGFDELVATEDILSAPPAEKANAIENKSGPIFDAIKKRLSILKYNAEMKNEIASVFSVLATLDEDVKQEVIKAMRSRTPLARTLDENNEKLKHLARLLSRLGLYSSVQKKYVVSRDIIWLEGEEAKKMDGVLAELAKLEPELQWKNAQRQIKAFSEEEEKEFAEIQKKYLVLLNLRDQLIQDYKKREAEIQSIFDT